MQENNDIDGDSIIMTKTKSLDSTKSKKDKTVPQFSHRGDRGETPQVGRGGSEAGQYLLQCAAVQQHPGGRLARLHHDAGLRLL